MATPVIFDLSEKEVLRAIEAQINSELREQRDPMYVVQSIRQVAGGYEVKAERLD